MRNPGERTKIKKIFYEKKGTEDLGRLPME